jgi:invasion protein IalB
MGDMDFCGFRLHTLVDLHAIAIIGSQVSFKLQPTGFDDAFTNISLAYRQGI